MQTGRVVGDRCVFNLKSTFQKQFIQIVAVFVVFVFRDDDQAAACPDKIVDLRNFA